MEPRKIEIDWAVTPERVSEAVHRIVAKADPLRIIAFGSRARGDHRPDSDLDLAVILDVPEAEVDNVLPYTVLRGVKMSVDMIPISRAVYDLHRTWLNNVCNYVEREGIVLYDREHPESARPDTLHSGSERRIGTHFSAA